MSLSSETWKDGIQRMGKEYTPLLYINTFYISVLFKHTDSLMKNKRSHKGCMSSRQYIWPITSSLNT